MDLDDLIQFSLSDQIVTSSPVRMQYAQNMFAASEHGAMHNVTNHHSLEMDLTMSSAYEHESIRNTPASMLQSAHSNFDRLNVPANVLQNVRPNSRLEDDLMIP